MSLHCPATLIVVSGPNDVAALADRVRERRVAAVYTGERRDAASAGRRLATELGVVASTMTGLDEASGGPEAMVDTGRPRLEDILRPVADLHRGETVLVLLASGPDAGPSTVEVEIGDDGVRVLGG